MCWKAYSLFLSVPNVISLHDVFVAHPRENAIQSH